MFYTIYQITNLVNQKIYIGAHETKNVNDNYMGSGVALARAKQKYGVHNFAKQILHIFDNPHQMWDKERELVTEEFCKASTNYNIRLGGLCGWTPAEHKAMSSRGGKTAVVMLNAFIAEQRALNTEWWQIRKAQAAVSLAAVKSSCVTPAAIAKRKDTYRALNHQQGMKNSQYGTMWITDGYHNKKIKKDSPIPAGYTRGMLDMRSKPTSS